MAEFNWESLPVGAWFFMDTPSCLYRYSVMERTNSGYTSICSTAWQTPQAPEQMKEIAALHNREHALAAHKAEEGKIHEWRLCEILAITPRPGQVYRFSVDETCEKCMALAKPYIEQGTFSLSRTDAALAGTRLQTCECDATKGALCDEHNPIAVGAKSALMEPAAPTGERDGGKND